MGRIFVGKYYALVFEADNLNLGVTHATSAAAEIFGEYVAFVDAVLNFVVPSFGAAQDAAHTLLVACDCRVAVEVAPYGTAVHTALDKRKFVCGDTTVDGGDYAAGTARAAGYGAVVDCLHYRAPVHIALDAAKHMTAFTGLGQGDD